jgi:pyroglutamyl-peptidase
MMKILVTGFEPFAGDSVNPSLEAIRVLASFRPAGVKLAVAPLPVSAGRIMGALADVLAEHRPDAVIAVGLAAGRAEMSVERVAINVDDFRIPDNDGAQPVDAPIVADGPAAYFSTLPIKAIVSRMRAAGVPAHVSQTAGTYLCNHVFYAAAHLAATRHPGMRAGFVHVPALPEQAARNPGQPSMALETIVGGLKVAIETVRDVTADLRVSEGQTH